MTLTLGGRKVSIGQLVAAVGAAVAVVGTILAWETLNSGLAALAGESDTVTGISSGGGKVILVLGIVVIVLVVLAVVKTVMSAKNTAIAIVVCGAVMALLSVTNYLSISDDVNKGNALMANLAGIGMGIYVTLVGAIAVVVGGVLGLISKE
jgi:hypothetical protein